MNPWNWSWRIWISALVAMFLSAPFITRWVCLREVPDLELPFDVDHVLPADVTPDEDAFVGCRHAEKLLAESFSESIQAKWAEALRRPYSVWDDELTEWVIAQRPIVEEFQRASQMEGAAEFSITDVSVLRQLVRLSDLTAILLERSDQCEDSLSCRRAMLRSAVHADHPGYQFNCIVGTWIRGVACKGISRWAADPAVTGEQLRRARDEIAKASEKRFSVLHTLKAEYVFAVDQFRKSNPAEVLNIDWNLEQPMEQRVLALKRAALWSMGQPDLLLRLARQQFVNLSMECDKPFRLRGPGIRDDDYLVFDVPPGHANLSNQMTSTALSYSIDRMRKRLGDDNVCFSHIKVFIQCREREDANLATLSVLLAAQEFQRANGEFPMSLDQLVPEYLNEIPLDPMDKSGSPLRYRREASGEAVVWSIGEDHADNDGTSLGAIIGDVGDYGYQIHLRSPLDLDDAKPD